MGKTAFVFPGQGAQYQGMGKDFYETYPVFRAVFEKASKAAGMDVKALCFEEPEKIHITEYTQTALLAMSAGILAVLKEEGISSSANAGLSLGEYAALIASGVLKEEDAFWIVKNRGKFMQEAMPHGGAMAAVLGLEGEVIQNICKETKGIVSVANDNCPGQIVITGEESAVQAASEELKKAGARRVLPLKVSGPFHSALMEKASRQLEEILAPIEIEDIQIPYITNVTGDYVTKKEQVKDILVRQVSSPVLWRQGVERLLADGVTLFVEIGPGKTLTNFLKKIDPKANGIHIETPADLTAALPIIKEEAGC